MTNARPKARRRPHTRSAQRRPPRCGAAGDSADPPEFPAPPGSRSFAARFHSSRAFPLAFQGRPSPSLVPGARPAAAPPPTCSPQAASAPTPGGNQNFRLRVSVAADSTPPWSSRG